MAEDTAGATGNHLDIAMGVQRPSKVPFSMMARARKMLSGWRTMLLQYIYWRFTWVGCTGVIYRGLGAGIKPGATSS